MLDNLKKPYYQHIIIEILDSEDNGDSMSWLREKIELLLKEVGLKSIKNIQHQFKPQGISLVYILSTSHIAVHTWPESGYIHMDLITCVTANHLDKLETHVKKIFPNKKFKISKLTY